MDRPPSGVTAIEVIRRYSGVVAVGRADDDGCPGPEGLIAQGSQTLAIRNEAAGFLAKQGQVVTGEREFREDDEPRAQFSRVAGGYGGHSRIPVDPGRALFKRRSPQEPGQLRATPHAGSYFHGSRRE